MEQVLTHEVKHKLFQHNGITYDWIVSKRLTQYGQREKLSKPTGYKYILDSCKLEEIFKEQIKNTPLPQDGMITDCIYCHQKFEHYSDLTTVCGMCELLRKRNIRMR